MTLWSYRTKKQARRRHVSCSFLFMKASGDARSGGGRAEPGGEVGEEVLLVFADPGDVAVRA
jgi:hypothetical protein